MALVLVCVTRRGEWGVWYWWSKGGLRVVFGCVIIWACTGNGARANSPQGVTVPHCAFIGVLL